MTSRKQVKHNYDITIQLNSHRRRDKTVLLRRVWGVNWVSDV